MTTEARSRESSTRFEFGPETRVDRGGGVEIAYWSFGEGLPVTLITGWGTPAASWSVMPKLLADAGYRAIVVDNRDCGKSSPCEGMEYTVADMADDVAAVLDDAGVDSTYLFAISMGGMIGQELALNHPERVRKLMLVATSPGKPEAVVADPEVLARIFTPPQGGDPVDAMGQLLGKLMGPGFADNNQDLIRQMAERRVALGSDAGGFFRQWQAITEFGSWNRLPSIKVPTLIMHGTDDPLVPFPNGEKLASRIPGAQFLPLDGVGHFVPLEAPAETFQAIGEFFPVEEKVS